MTSLQPIQKRHLRIRISRRIQPLSLNLLRTLPPCPRHLPPIHSFQNKPIRRIPQQRRSHKAQRSVERNQIPWCIFLAVQLGTDDARQVTEAVYAEDERAFPRLGVIAAEPGYGERGGDVASKEEDA